MACSPRPTSTGPRPTSCPSGSGSVTSIRPASTPYSKITPAVIDDTAHQQLSRKAADEAMVLLKNSAGTLPLNPATTKKIAVVGPLKNTLYSEWYSGNLPYKITPLDGITQR